VKQDPRQVPNTEHVTDRGMIHSIGWSTAAPKVDPTASDASKRFTPAPAVLFNGILAILMLIPNDFNSLVNYFSFVSWVFYGATVSALLYFRYKLPDHPRPVKVPLILPIFVGLSSIALCLVPIVDNPQVEFLIPVIFLLIGLLVYVPFYHYRWSLPGIKSFIIFLQKILFVAPPETDDDEKDKKKTVTETDNNNHKNL
jgi:amino acid transporter